MTRQRIVLLVLVVSACSKNQVVLVGAIEGVAFDGAAAGELLKPCSRDQPAPVAEFWTPQLADIQTLEAALPDFLVANPPTPLPRSGRPSAESIHQYVGLVRDGRRLIYVSAFPKSFAYDINWAKSPVVICDGGSNVFGVEYDMLRRSFLKLSYNGVG